jgi:4-hydroxybenzoate polyprenyltransferase
MAASIDPPTSLSPWQSLRLVAGDIKIAHSVFALPFAVLAATMVSPWADHTSPRSGALAYLSASSAFAVQLALILACMVAARTWAMLFNRLVDRDIDARNARTQRRVFARGVLSSRQGWFIAGLCAASFIALCACFAWGFGNFWPLALSVPVLAWIAFYSLTKRFTWLCHLFLGGALAVSPLAAVLAIDPAALRSLPAVWWLSAFVLCWVAGFDIIYALQDRDFDRANRLRSIPAALGTRGAIWCSRALHVLALLALTLAHAAEARFGTLFIVGMGLVAALLLTEHIIITRLATQSLAPRADGSDDPPPVLNMVFFTLNGVVSCVLGLAGVLDLVM